MSRLRSPWRSSVGLPCLGISGWRTVVMLVWVAILSAFAMAPAHALEPIPVDTATDRVDLDAKSDRYDSRGDQIQVDTAAGVDGIAGRMSVTSQTPGTSPSWVVFALRNTTDKPIERWLTADRYTLVGSGVMQPDLDASRLLHVTPSLGYVPERVSNDRVDIFRISLDPNQTVTFVVELPTVAAGRFPKLNLWDAKVYESRLRERTLFNGIALGITGLLALFMTVIFGANHKLIFPSMALVAWSVLAYLCVDFGFWHKIFQLSAEDNSLYRATAEAAMAGSFVLFLYSFLRIGQWHSWLKLLYRAWIGGQVLLLFLAVVDPVFAVTLSRLSFVAAAGVGALFTFYLAARGQDRALALAPAWILFVVWVLAAGLALNGRLGPDIASYGLVSGIVAILMLMSYSVTQFAFRAYEPLHNLPQNALQTRSLAIDAAGSAVWEWNARKDEITVSGMLEEVLGLAPGDASGRVDDWMKLIHSVDRDKLRLSLTSIQERSNGVLQTQFRMRRSDGTYRWFELKAASFAPADQQNQMCIGLLRDVTHVKRAHERMVNDAVIDSLTGLPNRALFLDRVGMAIRRADDEPDRRLTPTILFIDLDRFKSVNNALGLIVGDSMLLTAAKRLSRHIAVQDSLGRIGGDQFAILLSADVVAEDVALLAERVRRSLRSPMKIAGKDVVLTGSIGIAAFDGSQKAPATLLHEAEMAMFRAKRAGTDRIEIFKPAYRTEDEQPILGEADLKRAIERRQFRLLYQPVLRLTTEEVAGFEINIRLDHPKFGMMTPEDFLPAAESHGLAAPLALHLVTRVVRDLVQWHKVLPRADEPLFAILGIGREPTLSGDFVQEIKVLCAREHLTRNSLRLKIDEASLMQNAERAVEVIEWLKGAGAGVSVENFGTGFSSLAHLARVQVDTYQLDRVLVHDGLADPQSAGLIRALIAMARELGRSVIAEGIETSEDVAFLRSVGCQFGQGSHFSEPLGDRDVMDVLEAIRDAERKGERRGLFGARKASNAIAEPPLAAAVVTNTDETRDVPQTKRRKAEPVREHVREHARDSEPAHRNRAVSSAIAYSAHRQDDAHPDDRNDAHPDDSGYVPEHAAAAGFHVPLDTYAPPPEPLGTRVDPVGRTGGSRAMHRPAPPAPIASEPPPMTQSRRARIAPPSARAASSFNHQEANARSYAEADAGAAAREAMLAAALPRAQDFVFADPRHHRDSAADDLSLAAEGLARLSRGRLPIEPQAAPSRPSLSQTFEPPAPTAEELMASIASMNARVRGE
jgi:diguanylate cyclase (GGDEF)-like protein/PAS domain S-box-containing protein